MTELDIQRAIQLEIGSREDARVFRINVGVAVPINRCCPDCKSRGAVRFGLPGMADLLGIRQGGQFLSIEVKSPRGRESKEQIAWGQMIQKYGGMHIVARSTKDVLTKL